MMDRSFRANAAHLSSPYSSNPFNSLQALQTECDHRHVSSTVEYLLQASWISPLFPLQVTKNERQVMKPLYDRYRLVKQILSRANTIPIIVSTAFFWGLFLWFQEETGITTLLHTTQSLRLSPNLPYHSKIKQINHTLHTEVGQSWSRDSSAHL